MKTTIEKISSQSSDGVWIGGELFLAHLELTGDDLEQIHGQSPFFEILPQPGFNRMYSLLQAGLEWRPGKIFDTDCSLIFVYGSEILNEATATAGPPGQPLVIKAGDFSEVGDGGAQVNGQFAYMPFTSNASFALSAATGNKSLCLNAGKSFAEPGSITGYSVGNGEPQGLGYTEGEEITLGDFAAVAVVDSVDGDGAVLVSHLSSGGDPEYNVGDTVSDAHSGEEGHGSGFTAIVDSTDAPPIEGELYLELLYRVVRLHSPIGIS